MRNTGEAIEHLERAVIGANVKTRYRDRRDSQPDAFPKNSDVIIDDKGRRVLDYRLTTERKAVLTALWKDPRTLKELYTTQSVEYGRNGIETRLARPAHDIAHLWRRIDEGRFNDEQILYSGDFQVGNFLRPKTVKVTITSERNEILRRLSKFDNVDRIRQTLFIEWAKLDALQHQGNEDTNQDDLEALRQAAFGRVVFVNFRIRERMSEIAPRLRTLGRKIGFCARILRCSLSDDQYQAIKNQLEVAA